MDKRRYSSPLDLKQVKVTDGFWGREQELVRREVIPYQWEALNDRIPDAAPSYCMRNFKVAGRLMREKREQGAAFVAPAYTWRGFEALPEDPAHPDQDKFYGFVFQDSDFAKWIEAVGYSLTSCPDPELERVADEAIEVVCAAQAENGYLDTYYIINGMDRIFTNLRDHHELYCFGHLLEGAVAYYQATGKDKLLNAAKRYADFIVSRFGPEEGKCKGYPGHEIAEMALAKLYEVTGERRYLELSRFFLEMRGRKPYYFDLEEKERAAHGGTPYREPDPKEIRHAYHQADRPVKEQSEAVGHAVRAVYLYSGMADVARLTGDDAMFEACERLWNNIVREKLYVTGGIGGTHVGEAFSYGYDLPNDTAYSETCAAIGLAFFARRMLEIQADHRYGDVMEQALYNTVLAGMALDGRSFFYVNPLEVVPEGCRRDERKRHVKTVRQKWFGCACCPPNIARIVSSLGAYMFTQSEDTLYTHLYVGSDLSCSLNGRTLDMRLESGFPWDGSVRAELHAEESVSGTLAFRVPGWCGEMTAEVRESAGGGGSVICCRVERSGGTQISAVGVRCEIGRGVEAASDAEEPGGVEAASAAEEQRGVEAASDAEGQRGVEAASDAEEPGGVEAASDAEGQRGVEAASAAEEQRGVEAASDAEEQGRARLSVRVERGYLYLTGEWRDGDEILINIPMEVRCVAADTRVRENIGKVAFMRGPICYCMEEADNGRNLHLLKADMERLGEATAESSHELGHEMNVLRAPGRRQAESDGASGLYHDYKPPVESAVTLTFVPYYAWNNRGEGEMSVWVAASPTSRTT